MYRLLSVVLVLLLLPGHLSAQDFGSDTIFVADRFLSSRPISGATITAKFRTHELRATTLRLDAPVVILEGRSWTLGDILVTADFNGNGYIAIWTVAGPEAVVERHVAHVLEMTKDRERIYDHGIRSMAVKCACD